MIYKVFSDEWLLYTNTLDSLVIKDPKLSMELNSVGSFSFKIYPNHPYFDKLKKMESVITVYQDDYLIFKGRIVSDESGWNNEKNVICESDAAYLLDSIQRPYEFTGSPADLFAQYIANHNAMVSSDRQFIVGNVTVTDPNNYILRSDSTYLNTWDSIQQKLVKELGGFIWIRHEAGGNYIDYLADSSLLAPQSISFAVNLLSFKRKVSADDIFTVILPLGAEVSDEETGDSSRVTIESVNEGVDTLENADAVAKYGRIVKMIEWPDVTEPINLKTKAQAYLNNAVLLSNTIELTAADLSGTDANITPFHLGVKVTVSDEPHNVSGEFLIKKLSIDLLNPANNKLALGTEFKSLTEAQSSQTSELLTEIVTKTEAVQNSVIYSTEKQISSSIERTESSILSQVSENYYLKSDTDALISSVNSSLEQTKEGFNFTFEEFSRNLQSVADGTDAEFEEIRKYIRFVNGKIYLGEVGNQLELQIGNDRISFFQNNTEVAYFSNDKLFVVDGEYTNSLRLGKFAFLPRTNGNLSFKKVVD